jgi:hypothetical protein
LWTTCPKAVGHTDDCRREVTDAEVVTSALGAAFNFGGNIERSRSFLQETGLVPRMLSRSRLNRRLHGVAGLVHTLFHQLGAALEAGERLDAVPARLVPRGAVRPHAD